MTPTLGPDVVARPLSALTGRNNMVGHAPIPPRQEREMPAPSEPLRIVVADDHTVYRQGLANLLRNFGIEVVGEAANGLAAIEQVQETAPDVVVMDLNMPRLSGVEATRRLTERMPATRVLVVSVSEEETDVTEAILAGASGYVLKDSPVEEVVAGIRAAAAGDSLISPRIASMLLLRIAERGRIEPELPPVPLSDRELEVLRLVAEGKTNQEIGEVLFIDPSTVRNHISSILEKLQVDNRVQAAVRAVRGRLV
jgi:DNA-binding NarL/FixJ family response regulator